MTINGIKMVKIAGPYQEGVIQTHDGLAVNEMAMLERASQQLGNIPHSTVKEEGFWWLYRTTSGFKNELF